MPLRAFLSHASADKPLVEEVKSFLEDGGDIECWLDSLEIGFGANIVSRISDGLAKADFLLLFLSPVSLKSPWVEEEWTAAFWPQANSGKTRLVPVLIGDCQPPPILANKKYCDLRTNQLENMRQLKTWLLRERPAPVSGDGAGASLPNFIGREAELRDLKDRLSRPGALVPIVGMPGIGKTYLAREFIRRHGGLFESVFELECQKKDLAALSGALSMKLGLRLDGEANQVAADLRQYLSHKRCLLLLDNVDDNQPGALVPGGRASVLATARDGTIPFLADHPPEIALALFSDEEALDLFRRVLGPVAEAPARQLFRKLGHLPIAIAVAAGMIRHDLRHTVESLAAGLPALERVAHGTMNVGRLLRDAVAALAENERQLLAAMAACAPAGTKLGFAAQVAGLSEGGSLDALQGVFQRSLVVEMDRAARRYRLHPLIREAAEVSPDARERHARLVRQRLEGWEKAPLASAEMIEEAEQAVRALGDGAGDVAAGIAVDAGNLSRALGRLAEAYEFYRETEELASRAARQDWLHRGLSGQANILYTWGRLEEAMALHKKQEAICLGLGDRASLQGSYGNQALILKAWGRLEEAMALHKKEDAIALELGDRGQLMRSYGNQAVILKAWGRLEEAMALYKKQEAICLELGNRAALQVSYGNQANILRDWGRLAEALALYKKKEAICLDLGYRAGLAYCYWNWGLLLRAQGDPTAGRQKLEQALAIFTDLNMPLERDAVQRLLEQADATAP